MRYSWRHLLTMLLLLSAGLGACLPGPARAVGEGGDEPEPARKNPLPWRDDPEQYRRLTEEWKTFRKLPAEKQDKLRLLDEQLNEEPPAVRARLWAVLDRYSAWLKGLDEKDRQLIESTHDTDKKLEIIRALREREWVSHLAKAERERIDQAPAEDRPKLVESLRQKERKKRDEWQTARRVQGETPPPQIPAALWQRILLFKQKALIPTLKMEEHRELERAASNSWAEHAQKLSELAARHPILVPPSERVGVVSFADPIFPEGYGRPFMGRGGRGREGEGRRMPRELQGRWPNFALEVERLIRNRKLPPLDRPLGPCRQEEFVKEVSKFIDEELRTDPAAAKKLDEATGKWPDYPFAVMQLAKEKGLRVPGTYLPGGKELWEKAKAPQAE
jgi:hypothetical protein